MKSQMTAILKSRSEREQGEIFQVVMASDEFGGEEFNYDTLKEAYEGIARLATKSAKLNDGIKRNFYLQSGDSL